MNLTLILLLLLVGTLVALAEIANVRMFGWTGGFAEPPTQLSERVVEREFEQLWTQRVA